MSKNIFWHISKTNKDSLLKFAETFPSVILHIIASKGSHSLNYFFFNLKFKNLNFCVEIYVRKQFFGISQKLIKIA